MPQFNSTSVLGDDLGISVFADQLTLIALWFTGTQIAALKYRKVGVLRLIELAGTRRIIVKEWDVIYPGIYPVFYTVQKSTACELRFNSFRPGLAYSMFYQ